MLVNSLGKQFSIEESIFPLISYDRNKNICKCIGTGFFINGFGGFVTAKHVFFDNANRHLPTLYAIQTSATNERHLRSIKSFIPHPNADIGVGFLANESILNGKNISSEIATSFTLNLNRLNNGSKISTYAFPLSETKILDNEEFEFTFSGKWSSGIIEEFREEGSPLVRNECYQTTMPVEHGDSGGPVLQNNLVIGVNSSGMQFGPGEQPISFITPISYILDLSVLDDNKLIPIKELINKGFIRVK